MSLADRIHVNTRYTRSINVERDRGSSSIVEAYLPTARSVGLLEDVAAALSAKDQPRAWSLIGPYGSRQVVLRPLPARTARTDK